jgi:hypothetical protein
LACQKRRNIQNYFTIPSIYFSIMKKNNCLLIFAIASVTLFSCGKDGAVGPAGAQGPAGAVGPTGKDGSQGVNTYLFRNKKITLATLTGGGSTAAVVLQVPAITADILSKGAVLAYTDYGTFYGAWYALPVVQPNYLYITTTRIEPGDVGINVYFPMDNISSITADFEIVVIQGASVTQLSIAHPNVNFNDYNQVASLFGLNK